MYVAAACRDAWLLYSAVPRDGLERETLALELETFERELPKPLPRMLTLDELCELDEAWLEPKPEWPPPPPPPPPRAQVTGETARESATASVARKLRFM